MKVLIAEDDLEIAHMLRDILRHAGHRADVFENGDEALAAAQSEPYDALVTDWMMPVVDGIELTRRVRETVDPAPAILMITAIGSEDARAHAFRAGADGFLEKPFNPKRVLAALEGCVGSLRPAK
jgi:DNA-binding response OmpR family regulator